MDKEITERKEERERMKERSRWRVNITEREEKRREQLLTPNCNLFCRLGSIA